MLQLSTHASLLILLSLDDRSPSRLNGSKPILHRRSAKSSRESFATHPLRAAAPTTSSCLPVPWKLLSPTPPGKSGGGLAARNDSLWCLTYSRLRGVSGTEGMYMTAEGPDPWCTDSTAWIVSTSRRTHQPLPDIDTQQTHHNATRPGHRDSRRVC